MLKIAITGGIGSGKSLVADYLENKGYPVLYADKIAGELISSGGEAIPYVREKFGDKYIKGDGSLNRKMISELIFNDENSLNLYEKGTTNLVVKKINSIIDSYEGSDTEMIFAEIPLLFEKGMQDNFDFTWLILSSVEIRIDRIKKRDGKDSLQIHNIMKNQLSDDIKKNLSDEVIYNNGTKEDLYKLIDDLLIDYKVNKIQI